MAVDYQIRCKRCGYPYYPIDIENRICTFCKRMTEVRSRDKRLNIMVNSIKRYSKNRKMYPSKEAVVKWITSKFEVNRNTVNSYLKELKDKDLLEVFTDGIYERVRLL